MTLLVLFLLKFWTLLSAENPAPGFVEQQVLYNRDSAIFEQKRSLLNTRAPLAVQTLVVAQSFKGAPYVNGTLEGGASEQLRVNLRELDCWTFVENSVAIALAGPESDYSVFQDQLRNLRYWGGTIDGYGSRIHYFCGWVLQAEKSGLLEDLTRDLGGIPLKKKFDYITRRPARYPKIQDENTFRALRGAEQRISAHAWHYVPKSKVAALEKKIQEGDILLLVSSKSGLDIAHEGFAVKIRGRIHLLHASSLGKKVLVSAEPLAPYLSKQKGMLGVMVMRLLG